MVSEWEILVRLTLSCVLGGVIGYERQSRRKSAGLRTNMLVCLGSCLVMLISTAIYQGVEAGRMPILHALRRRSSLASVS